MNKLQENITNLFGQPGVDWLDQLPTLIEYLAHEWNLTDLQPVDNMTYNFVAKANHPEHGPVVVKLSFNEKMISGEIRALTHFGGTGMVDLIAINPTYHAILLHQAIPGNSLKSLYAGDIHKSFKIYADIVKSLSSAPQPSTHAFKHIRDWLLALDKANPKLFPHELLQHSIELKAELLDSLKNEYILHGDLHHDNILCDGNSWMAIDPKGIIGEIEFEAAAFDFLSDAELDSAKSQNELKTRILGLAERIGLDPKRLTQWVFVRSMLGAAWAIEGGSNPHIFSKHAIISHKFL